MQGLGYISTTIHVMMAHTMAITGKMAGGQTGSIAIAAGRGADLNGGAMTGQGNRAIIFAADKQGSAVAHAG